MVPTRVDSTNQKRLVHYARAWCDVFHARLSWQGMVKFYKGIICVIYTIICLKSVVVRTLQVAILARSPREMSLTDRIPSRYILSRVRVSVRPRIFLYAKNPQTRVAVYFDPLCDQINNRIGYCITEPAGGVAVTRLAINYDVSDCGVRVYEFKTQAGKNIFSHLLFAINKAYP